MWARGAPPTTWLVTLAATVATSALTAVPQARANPRPLPFTYQTESLAKGTGEVEQFIDFVPVRVLNGLGSPTWYNATELQTEIEYGVTDKLELAIYFMFVPNVGADRNQALPTLPMGNGSSQRLRYRFADPGAWPIDVAVYGEVTENEREIELEAKVILQRRFGRLRLITNLWAEHEFYFSGKNEWVLNPTLGATVELSPRFHVGLESWMRAEIEDEDDEGPSSSTSAEFNRGPHVFVGPAFMMNLGPVWWATGVYLRATDWDRSVQVGDNFGRVWIRSVVGIGF
jgi:hypothetical protein